MMFLVNKYTIIYYKGENKRELLGLVNSQNNKSLCFTLLLKYISQVDQKGIGVNMGILNDAFKFVEPAASEILKNIALGLFDIDGEAKGNPGNDYIKPVINQAISTASTVAVNELIKTAKKSNPNISEYEVAKLEKYTHTF